MIRDELGNDLLALC